MQLVHVERRRNGVEDVFQVNYRHVIFTIDEGLRDVFLMHRKLLKEFMDTGLQTG